MLTSSGLLVSPHAVVDYIAMLLETSLEHTYMPSQLFSVP